MRFAKAFGLGLLFVSLAVSPAAARNLFVLPGDGVSRTVNVFTQDPFSPTAIASFQATPTVFSVLTNLTGTKYYAISRSGTDSILFVDAAFNVTNRVNLGSTPETALLTPDGNLLLVLAGTLRIFSTSNDTEINPPSTLDLGPTPRFVAVNQESTRAFVLSSTRLTAVDLTTRTVIAPSVTISGLTTGVYLSPNGSVYVTVTNRVYEIDPRTMLVRAEIPINALPSGMVFTPDGRYALFVNQTPITGAAMYLLDLATRQPLNFPSFGVTLDRLFVVSNNRAYALSNQTRVLYQVTVTPFNLDVATFPGTGFLSSVTAVALSNETPVRSAFVAAGNTIHRIDVGTSQITGSAQVAVTTGALALPIPASTGLVSSVLQFNNVQTVGQGGTPLGLIFVALGVNGQPLLNAEGVVTPASAGVTVPQPTVRTNANGFGVANVTLPTTPGSYQVTILVGGQALLYTLNVSGSGGTPGASGGINIFSGNGQVIREQFQTRALVVVVTDNSGNPARGVTVTFALTQGQGTMQDAGTFIDQTGAPIPCGTPSGTSGLQATSTTDASGRACAIFLGTLVNPGQSYAQATISATSTQGSVNFVVTTIINTLPGSGGLAGDPTVVLLTPTLDTLSVVGRVGSTVAGAIRVLVVASSGVQAGQPIPNIGVVAFTGLDPTVGPVAGCVGGAVLTDAQGIATCDLALSGRPGVATLRIEVGGFQTTQPVNLQANPGLPATIRIVQGNSQSANAGQRVPLALVGEVVDGAGNILTAVNVQWEVVTSGTLTLQNTVSVSDANGRISTLATAGPNAGTFQVRVRSLTGAAVQTFNVTVNVLVGGLSKVSGDNQEVFINQSYPQPVVVRVSDTQGQPVAGFLVAFAISGSGSLGAGSATTNSQGQASTTITAGGTAGSITVTASIPNFNVQFTLTSRVPGPVFSASSFFNSAGFQGGAVSPCGIYDVVAGGLAPGLEGTIVASPILGLPLPTTLRNVRMFFGGAAAPIYLIENIRGRERAVVQVPCETQAPSTNVQIFVGTVSTVVPNVPVLAAQPGTFETAGADGRRYAVAINEDGSLNTVDTPIARGKKITILMTGMGQTTPLAQTNRVGVAGQKVEAALIAGINDSGVPIESAVYGSVPGVYEVTILVPLETAPGSFRNLGVAAILADGTVLFANGSAIHIQ